MSENVFDSYLVKLGFSDDPAGFAKFKSTLTDAAGIAASRTESIVKSLGKWQGAIVGGFAVIGTAAVGIADKLADADLGYQLFATRMFMGVDAAKQLSIATDVLGHSLDEIAWNPELHERFDVLLSDQQRIADVLGHGFEPGLRNIRDIRFQFSRMQNELDFGLLPEIVSKVAHGLGGDDLLQKLQNVNDWVISHIPEIADTFSKYLVPVLKDGKQVLGDVVGMLEDTGVAFTNLVGLLSGDHSIEGTTFSFDHLLTAIDHVSHGFARFIGWITSAERILAHLASAAALLASGHFKDAAAELRSAVGNLTRGSGGILGGIAGFAGGSGVGAIAGGIVGTMLAPGVGTVIGAGLGGTIGAIGGGVEGTAAGAALGYLRDKFDSGDKPEHGFYVPGEVTSRLDIHALIDSLSDQFGINRAVAHAVAMAESGERQFNVSGRLVTSGKANGVFQLTPDTARAYGVNADGAVQNISGGLQLLSDLSKHYSGNLEEVLAAYNWGSGKLDRALARYGKFDESYLPLETRNYIHRVEGQLARDGDLKVEITVHAQTNADPHQIAQQVATVTAPAIRDAMRRQNSSNIAALSGRYQ